jgi:hypothetical protein
MKRFVEGGEALAAFHLEGDVVRIEWLVPGLEQWMSLSSVLDADGTELTLADGKRFYDRLEHAYPGSIETVA